MIQRFDKVTILLLLSDLLWEDYFVNKTITERDYLFAMEKIRCKMKERYVISMEEINAFSISLDYKVIKNRSGISVSRINSN